MEHDLQFHSDDVEFLRAELRHVVEFFGELGLKQCDVFFGWSWRAERDNPDPCMKSMNIALLDVEAEPGRGSRSREFRKG